MPTYDYRCDACGHEFEKFQKMSEGPSRKCPECGAYRLKRLLGTGSGIIFRGSGFYETDYKRKSGSNGKAGTSSSSSSSSSASGSSESTAKPEKKESPKSE